MNDDARLRMWKSTNLGKWCEYYTSLGWYIFPLHGIVAGRCTCGKFPCGEENKNAGKHPFTKHGFKDANNEIDEVAMVFGFREDLNIGVATGHSGFFILDVDRRHGGDLSLDELCRRNGELPPTRASITGNGFHIFFKNPDFAVSNSANKFKGFPGLDIRGHGGYIVLPPSKHFSGKIYHFPEGAPEAILDAPDWLLEMLTRKEEKAPKEAITPLEKDHNSGNIREWEEDEVWRMLEHLDPDMAYDDWLYIGMALHQGGFNLSLWDGWSRGGRKYENKCCEKRWHGFSAADGVTMGTLVKMAQDRGWRIEKPARPEIDTTIVAPLVAKARERLAQKEQQERIIPEREVPPEKPKESPQPSRSGREDEIASIKLPFHPMQLPGLIGDTVRWIVKYAIHRQPELAMLNTLAFAGAVFGRKYASELNTRTNVYMVGLGPTASGKDHSRKMITRLAHFSGLPDTIGANAIRSDTGLLRGLSNHSAQVMMLDEIGKVIRAVSDPKSPYHIQMISRILLTLYSDSSSVYNHGDYADPKSKPITIHAPNLCIYGTDTEASYIPSLKRSSIENGELNRFVILPVGRTGYPQKDVPLFEYDEVLNARWQQYAPKTGAGTPLGELVNSATIAPVPKIVKWGECEALQYKIQCEQTDRLNDTRNPARALWGRFFENTLKIAMMFAIARNKDEPVLTVEDFDIGRGIVECSTSYMAAIAHEHMAETPQEDLHNKILRLIRENEGVVARNMLLRNFRSIKRKEMDDILNGMIEQEVILSEKASPEQGTGRLRTMYYLPGMMASAAGVAPPP